MGLIDNGLDEVSCCLASWHSLQMNMIRMPHFKFCDFYDSTSKTSLSTHIFLLINIDSAFFPAQRFLFHISDNNNTEKNILAQAIHTVNQQLNYH